MKPPADRNSPAPEPGPPPRRRLHGVLRVVGVSVYALSVRIALAAVTWVLWAYFAVNSAFVAGWIGRVATRTIAGSVAVAHVQWGPAPGYLRLIRPVVRAADGTVVLRAGWLDVQVAWFQLLEELLDGREGLEVRILRARLVGPQVRLDRDPRGRLRLAAAFAAGAPEDDSKGAPFALAVDELEAREIGYEMKLGGTRISVQGGELEGRFSMRTAPGEPFSMSWETRQLSVANAAMRLAAFDAAGLEQLPGGPLVVQQASGTLDRIDLRGVSADLPHMRLDRGDVAVRLSPTLDVRGRGVRLELGTRAPFLERMLGPLFDARAEVDGSFHFAHTGLFEARAEVVGRGLLGGFRVRRLGARVSLGMVPGSPEKLRVVGRKLEVQAFGGRLGSDELTYVLAADGEQSVRARLRADRVSIGRALASPAVGIGGVAALALQGRLSGTIDSEVELRLPGARRGDGGARESGRDERGEEGGDAGGEGGGEGGGMELAVSLRTKARIARAEPGALLREAVPELAIEGGLDLAMGPGRGTRLALHELALTTVRSGGGTPGAEQWVKADGEIDLSAHKVGLGVDLNLPDLAALLAPLGVRGVAGVLSLRDARLDGDLRAPTVRAELHGKDLAAAGWSIEEVSGVLGLRRGTVSLRNARVRMLGARFSGDLAARLFTDDLGTFVARPALHADKLEVSGLSLARVLEPAGIPGIAAVADLRGGRLDVDLRRPMQSLVASGALRLRDLVVPTQRIRRLQATVAVHDGRVKLRGLALELPPTRTGTEPCRVQGELALDLSEPVRVGYRADLHFGRLDLDQIGYLRGLKMPLRGTIAGSLRAHGDLADLALDADLRIAGLAWDKIWMGDGRVQIHKARGKPATLSSERFFPKFELLEGSRVSFTRLVPTHLALHLRAAELDPFEFLGLEQLRGVSVQTSGKAIFRLDFRPGHDIFSVALDLPAGGMDVEMTGLDEPLRNRTAMHLKVLPTRIDIASTRIRLGRHDLELCGAFLYPDAAKGLASRLRMYVAGTLDLPRIDPLHGSLASLDLRLDVLPDARLRGDTAAWCLRRPSRGALRIAGPFDALRLDGTLRTRRSTIVPRGFGKEITLSEGGVLDLHTDAHQRMIVAIPRSAPLTGRIDDGAFRADGTVKLLKYLPDFIDLRLGADGYELVAPKEYSVVMSPSLRLTGRNLLHPTGGRPRKLHLSGTIEVSEASYTKSHDMVRGFGRRLLGGRTVGGAGLELCKNADLAAYHGLELDLQVNGRNIEVGSKFPGMRTDLELSTQGLQVGGTLCRGGSWGYEVNGRLVIARGSMITYEIVGREFEVEKGFLDFKGDVTKPLLDIVARTDVPLSAEDTTGSMLDIGPGVGGANSSGDSRFRQVKVWVSVSGPLLGANGKLSKDLNPRLWSRPSYDQANLMSLILTGSLLTGGGGTVSFSYLTDEISDIFKRALFKFDKLSVSATSDGGAKLVIEQKLGRIFGGFKAQRGGSQESTEARFSLRLSERWSMEGMARSTVSNTFTQNFYKASLRYRVPLRDFQENLGL